ETSKERVTAIIEGMLVNAYDSLILDEDERADGFKRLARLIWDTYMGKIPKERIAAIGLPPFEDMDRGVVSRMLDRERGLPPEPRAVLRTKLRLPVESVQPENPTNAPPEKVSSK